MSVASHLTQVDIIFPSSADLFHFALGIVIYYLQETMCIVDGLTVISKSDFVKTLLGMLTPTFHTL